MKPDPRSDPQDRDIATLIRAAGKRPAVPPERHERVRAAAHDAWMRETRRVTRRRQVWIVGALAAAAALILAVGLGVFPLSGPGLSPAGFTVETMAGTAWATPESGDPRSIAPGDRFATGSEIRTTEATRVALRLGSGHSVRLDATTRVRVLAGGNLALEAGTIYVDSGTFDPFDELRAGGLRTGTEGDSSGAVTVRTPFGRIEEIGTQFEVHLEAAAVRVRLREGVVILHDEAVTYPVAVGTEFLLRADGSTATRTVPSYDKVWNWVATVAPPFDLEGRTARSFLDWIARERGLRLVFSDAELARAADDIILAGKLEGVPVDEALDVVLPTCNLNHRVADGLLMVGRGTH